MCVILKPKKCLKSATTILIKELPIEILCTLAAQWSTKIREVKLPQFCKPLPVRVLTILSKVPNWDQLLIFLSQSNPISIIILIYQCYLSIAQHCKKEGHNFILLCFSFAFPTGVVTSSATGTGTQVAATVTHLQNQR